MRYKSIYQCYLSDTAVPYPITLFTSMIIAQGGVNSKINRFRVSGCGGMNSQTQISYFYMYYTLIYPKGLLSYADPRFQDGRQPPSWILSYSAFFRTSTQVQMKAYGPKYPIQAQNFGDLSMYATSLGQYWTILFVTQNNSFATSLITW